MTRKVVELDPDVGLSASDLDTCRHGQVCGKERGIVCRVPGAQHGVVLSEDRKGKPASPLNPRGERDSARQLDHTPHEPSIGDLKWLERPLVVQEHRITPGVVDLTEVIQIPLRAHLREGRIEISPVVRQRPANGGIELPAVQAPIGRQHQRGRGRIGHAVHQQPIPGAILSIVHPQQQRLGQLTVELEVPDLTRRLLEAVRRDPVLEHQRRPEGGASRVVVLLDALLKTLERVDLQENLVKEQPPAALDERPTGLVQRQRERRAG